MIVVVPVRTISEANRSRHEHWGTTSKRVKAQQLTVGWHLVAAGSPPEPPWVVKLTRIAPRSLDSHDNLRASLKACADAVAKWLGVDDADERVNWDYDQRKGKPKEYAVVVEIEGR